MPSKLKLSHPNRIARRAVKLANSLNQAAESLAETVVSLQDAAQDCLRLADELEEKERAPK